MNTTFKDKRIDWALIALTAILSIDSVTTLFGPAEFVTNYLLRVLFALTSIIAFILLVIKSSQAEKYARFFIIIVLLVPSIYIIYRYVVDLIIYGASRPELVTVPVLVKLVLGVVFFMLSIRYGKSSKAVRSRDYGLLLVLTGTFLIVLTSVKVIEAGFIGIGRTVQMVLYAGKVLIYLIVIYLGKRLSKEKIQLRKATIMALVLLITAGFLG